MNIYILRGNIADVLFVGKRRGEREREEEREERGEEKKKRERERFFACGVV